jgi:hypothetical protein
MDPEGSKYILDKLHEFLQELDLSSFNLQPNSNPDPDFLNYLALFLNQEQPRDIYEYQKICWPPEFSSSEYTNTIIKNIDNYNSQLYYPSKFELIKEKDVMLSKNSNINYIYNSINGFASQLGVEGFINIRDGSIVNWFLSDDIFDDIKQYNFFIAAKYYYDNNNSELLPEKFHDMWDKWQLWQCLCISKVQLFAGNLEPDDINHASIYVHNFLKREVAYEELLDNILIVGTGILCKVYILENILKLYREMDPGDINLSPYEFYKKIWVFHDESLQKYYPFFHYYNMQCKLYELEHCTSKSLSDLNSLLKFDLEEYMVNLPKKPLFHNDIRSHSLDYLKCSPFTKGLNLATPQFKVSEFFHFEDHQLKHIWFNKLRTK